MPQSIVRLDHEGTAYYLEWSTVVDAPTTYGMPLLEFKRWYRSEYGRSGAARLPERLARADATGTSLRVGDLAGLIECNRAGDGEACLTIEEIITKYIVNRGIGCD